MKVLHLATHLNTGGITAYIYKLIRPMRERGVEVHVLTSGGEWADLFKKAGAVTHELPIRTKNELNPKIYFAVPKVIRLVKEHKIDLLHAHTRITQVMAYWIQRLAGIPYLSTCHGYLKRRLGRRLLPAWGHCAIAISEPVEEMLKSVYGLSPSRVCRIINGVDIAELDRKLMGTNAEQVRRAYGFTKEDVVIGIVARLIEEKGHSYLLKAFAELAKERGNVRLLIVGDGKYRRTLESQIREQDLMHRVWLTGNVVDIVPPLACMDVFVLPVIWKEGFGLSITEAMACRVPVVASHLWALNTLIEDRENGLLVPPKDIAGLAGAIRDLIHDEPLRKKLTGKARQKVEAEFSIERMADECVKVYRKVLS